MATLTERTEQLINLQGHALGILRTLNDHAANIANLQGQALGVLRTLSGQAANIAGLIKSTLRPLPPVPAAGAGKNPTPQAAVATTGTANAPTPPRAAAAPAPTTGAGQIGALLGRLGAVGRILATVGRLAAGAGAAIAGVAAATVAALTALPLAALGAVKAVQSFVAALNPALVEQYNREQRNLSATIGFAFTPVIAYATRTVREWAGLLLPSIQKLQPLVERISAAVGGAMSGVGRLVARLADGLVTDLARFTPALERAIESLGIVYETLAAVVEVLNTFDFGVSALLGVTDACANGLRRLAIGLAVASAKLLAAFGGADALQKFKDSIARAIEEKKNPRGGLLAAPTDSSVTGIEEIARKLSERAYIAGAGGPVKPPDVRALEEILREISGIKPVSFSQVIEDAVYAAVWGRRAGGGGGGGGAPPMIGGVPVPAGGAVRWGMAVLNPAGALGEFLAGAR